MRMLVAPTSSAAAWIASVTCHTACTRLGKQCIGQRRWSKRLPLHVTRWTFTETCCHQVHARGYQLTLGLLIPTGYLKIVSVVTLHLRRAAISEAAWKAVLRTASRRASSVSRMSMSSCTRRGMAL